MTKDHGRMHWKGGMYPRKEHFIRVDVTLNVAHEHNLCTFLHKHRSNGVNTVPKVGGSALGTVLTGLFTFYTPTRH